MLQTSSQPGGLRPLALLATGLLLLLATSLAQATEPLRLAVVGGIELSGVGEPLRHRLEKSTGIPLVWASVAPKASVVPAFAQGEADLLLIHGGSETFALQAAGHGGRMRVWGFNEHVIVGPADDPAGIRGLGDAAEALRRIADSGAAFVAFADPGSHEIVQRLWSAAGVRASSDWVRLDETRNRHDILVQASRQHAYVVTGAIPVARGRLAGDGMTTLLSGDPRMRRAYVALEPGPRHPATAEAREQARRLVDHLLSEAGQRDLAAANAEAGGTWIYGLSDAPPALAGGH
ncbi:tungsten ABC transporter permease [Stutzerimonas tarimensis]|uniref:Tungsten ABC transporter permease n=1 Tax=Stutzerimonas tarimensis TaxID=1507735 RepID=A0ABV7TAA4_9GAMM